MLMGSAARRPIRDRRRRAGNRRPAVRLGQCLCHARPAARARPSHCGSRRRGAGRTSDCRDQPRLLAAPVYRRPGGDRQDLPHRQPPDRDHRRRARGLHRHGAWRGDRFLPAVDDEPAKRSTAGVVLVPDLGPAEAGRRSAVRSRRSSRLASTPITSSLPRSLLPTHRSRASTPTSTNSCSCGRRLPGVGPSEVLPAAAVDSGGAGRTAAADRVRERRESVARAGHVAQDRDGPAPLDWRGTRTADPADAGRKRAARRPGRRRSARCSRRGRRRSSSRCWRPPSGPSG